MLKLQDLPLVLLLCSHALASDRLIIEKITCKKTATGVSSIAKTGAKALGAIVGGGKVAAKHGVVAAASGVQKSVEDMPTTAADIAQSAANGSKSGLEALKFMDENFSGSDDLFVNIDGKKVFPKGTNYYGINAGESINPNIDFSFEGGCTIQFIEHDRVGAHDNLGTIVINTAPYDKKNPGKDFRVDGAILMSPIEGSIYLVDYRVERNKGLEVGEQWQVCGTDMCRRCAERWCAGSHDVLHGINMYRYKPNSHGCRFPSIRRTSIEVDNKKNSSSSDDPDWYLQICSTKLSSPLTKPPQGSMNFTGTYTFARYTNRQGNLGEKPDRAWFSG